MLRLSRSDEIRRWTNLLLPIAQIAVTTFSFAFGTSFNAAAGPPSSDPPIVPAEYAFIIWSVIYGGCVAYGVYQFRAAHAHDPVLRRIGWLTSVGFLGCCCWLLCVRFGHIQWTIPCILLMAVCMLSAFMRLPSTNHISWTFRLCVVAPTSIYAGWLSIAVFANTASVMRAFCGRPSLVTSSAGTIAFLVTAATLAGFMLFRSGGNLWYGGTILWALLGIGVRNQFELKNFTVAGAVWLLLGVFTIIIGLQFRLIFRPLTDR